MVNQKRRHHYVPQTYLGFFCDSNSKLFVYRKDNPLKELYQSPLNTAFQCFYYSQPLPDGGQDNNSIEDEFSKIEGEWPNIIRRLSNGEQLDSLDAFFTFVALQRVRVPASRDAMEIALADHVKATIRVMDEAGEIPNMPERINGENIADLVNVSIDPHQSIHGMIGLLLGIGEVIDRLGFTIIHNKSGISLLTSDNPVIWFDNTVSEENLRPYSIRKDGPVNFYMPLTPTLILFGCTELRLQFLRQGLVHTEISDRQRVKSLNRIICKFAYEAVFANKSEHAKLIQKHSSVSPIVTTNVIQDELGRVVFESKQVFGNRTKKHKWTSKDARKSHG